MRRFFRPLLGGIQLDAELSGSARMSDTILHCLAAGESTVPAAGMQAIPDQLASRLPSGAVHLGSPVAQVRPGQVRLHDGRSVDAAAVVVATEGPAAAGLLRDAACEVRDPGSRPVSCVWFDAPVAPVDHRLIVLDGVGTGPALNVAVMSNVAPRVRHRCRPQGARAGGRCLPRRPFGRGSRGRGAPPARRLVGSAGARLDGAESGPHRARPARPAAPVRSEAPTGTGRRPVRVR